MEEESSRKYHVLAVPYPSQGHINPMLQFCKRLSSSGPIKTTLTATRFISDTFSPTTALVDFASISDGFDQGGNASASSVADYLDRLQSAGTRTLADLIRAHKVDCVVYDAFLPWALDVAKGFGLPAAAFFTQACTVNYVYYLIHHRRLSLPVTSFPLPIDGLQALTAPRDMPSFVGVPGSYPAYFEMVLSQFSNAHRADFVLVNSVYELEQQAVDSMSKVCPLLTIGPTIPAKYLEGRSEDDADYGLNLFQPDRSSASVAEWLDGKPVRSVVYVSFGSMANLSGAQMEELAMGLEATECHFLWVVRSAEEEQKLPRSFGGSRGLVVRWSPQLEVLSHASVGCFFTHCGWNSTIEALSLGVPMVAMPQWTDQPTDARLVEELWKVGVRVDDTAGVVGRDAIAGSIRQVMGSEEFRTNAQKWRRTAVGAMSQGGSSDSNIRQFVSQLINMLQGVGSTCM